VAALHQGAPGQMTWLEDPPPWLRPGSKMRESLKIKTHLLSILQYKNIENFTYCVVKYVQA